MKWVGLILVQRIPLALLVVGLVRAGLVSLARARCGSVDLVYLMDLFDI